MKVAYLSYDGLTDPLGQSQILPYLEGLAGGHGHRFWLFSHEKEAAFQSQGTRMRAVAVRAGLTWLPLPYHKRPPVLSTLWDVIRQGQLVSRWHRRVGFDLLHCRSYLSALVGVSMKRRFGIPFLFDMRGFWADERVDGGLWNRERLLYDLIYRFFKLKERQFLLESEAVVSLTHKGKEEMLTWNLELPAEKVSVISCGCDLELFVRPLQVPDLGLEPDDYLLVYLGSIGTWYLLDEMLVFFRHLLGRRPSARFLFVTREGPASIRSRAAQLGVDPQRILVRAATRRQVPALLSRAQAGVYFIKPCYSKLSSSPTKLGEMLALELPVVTNLGVGDVARLVERGVGPLVERFEAAEYERALDELLSLGTGPHPRSRRVAEELFSLSDAIASYAAIYDRITARGERRANSKAHREHHEPPD